MYKKSIKPCFDYLFAVLVVLLYFPILFILSVLGLIVYKESPFFLQKRTGINGKTFIIFKLKTFKNDQVNGYGNILRKYSIDEFPQFINVLMGNMSIIGPRPLLPEYTQLYTSNQKQRLLVKPGITGWAQIHGRNNLDWEAKFAHDIWYVHNMCFWVDSKIFFTTLIQIFDTKHTGPAQAFVQINDVK